MDLEPPGGSVGPYELHAQLGKGGLGAVYRATDTRTGRPVALKLLAATEERSRQRLLLEARALARLRHRNVVALLEAGEERGRPWLALELVSGRSLEDRLREGPLPPVEAARLVRALAAGLAHAHREGVLHRDLKPANVLLPADGGEPRLADFGLAAVEAELDRSRLTKSGTLMGSPGWWSPEQAAGQASAVGPATDVYGLGALLYAALTGRPPIEGPSLMAILTATEKARPASPGADPELDALALRCLAKRPEERPPSVEAVARELSRWLAARSRRRGGRLAPALLVAGLVAAAALTLAWSRRREEPPPAAGVAPPASRAPATTASPEAGHVAAEVEALLAGASARLEEGRVGEAVRLAERALALAPRSAGAHLQRGRARAARLDWQGALVDLSRAVELDEGSITARVLRGLARAQVGIPGGLEDCEAALARAPDDLQALTCRGVVRVLAGEYAQAMADLDAVLARAPDEAEALAERGRCRARLGDEAGAIADLDRALALSPCHIAALVERAELAMRADPRLARELLERVLTFVPDHMGALCRRGAMHQQLGDMRAALADFDRVVHLDPRDTAALSNRGMARADLGDLDGALSDLDRVLAVEPRNPETLGNRAIVRSRRGELAGAIADFDLLISITPDDLGAIRSRGLCKMSAGDPRGALADFEAILARDPRHAFALVNRGDARAALGDLAGSVSDLEAGMELLPPGSPLRDELRPHLDEVRSMLETGR